MVLLQARGIADISTTQRTRNFLRKRLLVTELPQQGLMQEVLDVFGVVESGVGSGGLRGLLLITRLARVDP